MGVLLQWSRPVGLQEIMVYEGLEKIWMHLYPIPVFHSLWQPEQQHFFIALRRAPGFPKPLADQALRYSTQRRDCGSTEGREPEEDTTLMFCRGPQSWNEPE